MRNNLIWYFTAAFLAFASLGSLQATAEETEIRVIVAKAAVYLQPSGDSQVVAEVPMGGSLKAVEKTGEWYKVYLPLDKKGFVRSGFVRDNAVEVVSAGIEQKRKAGETAKDEISESSVLTPPPVRVQKEKGRSKLGFSLKLWGSGGALLGNQFNDHIKSQNEFYTLDPDTSVESEHPLMRSAGSGGAEFILSINPNFGVGFFVGYFTAKKDSQAEFSIVTESFNVTWTISPKITALPLGLSFYYGFPLGDRLRFLASAGVGFYYGKVYWGENQEYTSPVYGTGYRRFNWNTNSDALGFHGGLEMEWEMIRGIALVLGATGRTAAFTDLVGEADWAEYSSYLAYEDSGSVTDLTLWFYEEEYYGKLYPRLTLEEDEPTAYFMSNVEKARISMSHISFLFGIKIYLKK